MPGVLIALVGELKGQLAQVEVMRAGIEARLREIERLPQRLLADVFGREETEA
jgi:hypothetical protein